MVWQLSGSCAAGALVVLSPLNPAPSVERATLTHSAAHFSVILITPANMSEQQKPITQKAQEAAQAAAERVSEAYEGELGCGEAGWGASKAAWSCWRGLPACQRVGR